MKIAIMQPYFFPYIGYFQMINAVDEFVIYDNIKYTKKGWINRNRILVNGKDEIISLPLKKDSDYLNVVDRYLSATWHVDRLKLLNIIRETYRKAPYFNETYSLIEVCFMYEEMNLFRFILHSIEQINRALDIRTKIRISSEIKIDHKLKAQDKVVAIAHKLKASTYINPIGGVGLYNFDTFSNQGIKLCFLKSENVNYKQFSNDFVPWLSIIDVMMFNSKEDIQSMLNKYELV